MSRHRTQNTFHGSTGRPAPPRGGVQRVIARDVIGAFPCWCQGELCWVDVKTGEQDWPGKRMGKPHPSRLEQQVVALIKEGLDEMVHMQETLTRDEVKKYPRAVGDLLMTLVNDCSIRCRVIDGGHLLLYPPDGQSRPFKVSSTRSEKATLGFIERQFIAAYDVKMPKKEKPVGEPTQTIAPATTEKVRVERPSPPVEARPLPVAPTEPDTKTVWTRAKHTRTGEPLEWETDGKVFRCLVCKREGKEWTTEVRYAMTGHMRAAHNPEGLHTPEARAKQAETRRLHRVQERVAEAVAILQDAAGLEGHDEKIEALEARIEEMAEALAQVTAERDAATKRADDAEARVALIRESLSV
jgi:hypothetical protein